MVGDVVGSYRVIRKIGEGGMGTVYIAEHTLIGRHAAIKVLLREMSHRQDLVTRFFNEARAATAVKHPGIVEIYDFGYHTGGSAYIVMEYLEGESLSSRLRRTGPLPAARAAALGRQIAGALGAAHAKGIVHRDLKPDNIFIVRDPDIADGERTKILDFGIAKLSGGEQPVTPGTRTGMIMGTPAYMSPEQSRGAGKVDARTDLYALGCILFEMVCGRPPFVAAGAGDVMAQHIYAPVPAPSSILPVALQLEQLLVRALAKDPAHRFQTAAEMIAALQIAVPSGSFPHAVSTVAAPAHAPFAPVAAPVQTTLSAVTVTANVAPLPQRRGWIVPLTAIVAIAGGAATIVSSQGDGQGAITAKPPEPAPPATTFQPPAPRIPAPPAPAPAPATNPTPVPAQAPPPAPKAPTRVTIKLASEPDRADVYLMPQRVLIGRTPLVHQIDAIEGNVALTAKKHGYLDQKIAVPADHDTDQLVKLVPVARARQHERTQQEPAPTKSVPTELAPTEPKPPESMLTEPAPIEPKSREIELPDAGSGSSGYSKRLTLDPTEKFKSKEQGGNR